MPVGVTTANIGPFDDSWLGSRHAVANAHTGTLLASAFASVEGGVVPSGTPVARNSDGYLVPFNKDARDGTQVLAGFVLDDHDISQGDEPCAVLWHGRIKTANLPVEFTAPASSAFTFI